MNRPEVAPANSIPADTVTGPLARTGPEVPPDVAAPNKPRPGFANQPTAQFPALPPAAPPEAGTGRAPTVRARAVIVYEPEPRPRRGLWVFTGLLVALTVGVVLGQANAYQPAGRSAPLAQVVPPPESVLAQPSLPQTGTPTAVPLPGHRITAPLGSATERLIEVTGAATPLRIGSADLGDLLFSVVTVDGTVVPTVVDTARGPRLTLTPAAAGAPGAPGLPGAAASAPGAAGPPGAAAGAPGASGAAGAAGADVQLNAKVRWTVRLAGGAAEQVIDMRAGGLAGIELTGDTARVVLELPPANRTLAVRITGAADDLRIRTADRRPVRLRLAGGAGRATVDTTERRTVRPGATVSSPGWRSAADRYDISVSARVGSVAVDRAAPSRT